MATHQATTPALARGAVDPVGPNERIEIVDILRGFALFGILLVNMALFKAPWTPGQPSATTEIGALDRLAGQAIDLLATGKFFTLFSFLFGFGFAMQLLRAHQRGVAFVPRFARRLLVLLGFGLIHALLIWHGDILVSYALIGFVLILFRNRSPRALLIWAAMLLIGMALLIGAGLGFTELGRAVPEGQAAIAQAEAEALAQMQQESPQDVAIYGSGSYPAIVAERARDYFEVLFALLFMLTPIFAMFLLGLYAGKRQILHDVESHLPLLRRVRLWGLLLGLLLSALIVFAQTNLGMFSGLLAATWHFSLAGPFLSLGYAATIVLLARDTRWRARLAPLGAAGRMALTNYLTQSLICTTIFYGYGLGLFGQVGAATGILLTCVIYALQIPFSIWWLARFQFGPIEWLWRSLTYGRRQPMRRSASLTRADERISHS